MDAGNMYAQQHQHRPAATGAAQYQHQQHQQPCGASFGFDGKLVQYFNVKGAKIGIGDLPHQRLVTISKVVTLPELVARSERFDYALETGKIADFCQEKAQEVEDSSEAKVWQFLQASFSSNPTQSYLTMLGYDSSEIFSRLDSIVGKRKSESSDSMTDGFVTLGRGVSRGYVTRQSESENDDIESESDRQRHRSAGQDHDAEKYFEIATDDSTEGLINQALLSGNTEIAVNLCLQEGRWADALILASTGTQELIKKTQQKYLQKQAKQTSNMIVAIVTRDMRRLIEHCDLRCWKEALATALTYSDPLGFQYLAETLGRRLGSSENENFQKCALLCYICCGHINHLVESWALEAGKLESEKPEHLQDIVEQLMVLKKVGEIHGKEFPRLDQILTDKLVKYGALLVSQGSLKIALKYISDSTDPSIVDLKQKVDFVLGNTTSPVVRQARSRQTSESSRHYPLGKRPSYPTPAVQQMSPGLGNPYDITRRMSGYTDGPNISSLTGPPVAPQHVEPMGFGNQGFHSPLNVNTSSFTSPAYGQLHTPVASDLPSGGSSYYPQYQDRRNSGTLPPVSNAPHGWNDPPQLKAKPKSAVATKSAEAITHPIFGSAAPVPLQLNTYTTTPYGGGDGNSLLGYAPIGPPPPSGPPAFSQATSQYGTGTVPPYGAPPPPSQSYNSPPPPAASTFAPPQSARYGSTYAPPPTASFYQPPMSGCGTAGTPHTARPTSASNPPLPSNNGMPPPPSWSNFGPPPPSSSNFGAPHPPSTFGPPPTNTAPLVPPKGSYGAPSTTQGSFAPPMASTFAPPPTQNYNSAPPTSFPSSNAPTSFPSNAPPTSFPSSAPPTSFPSRAPPSSFPTSSHPPTSFSTVPPSYQGYSAPTQTGAGGQNFPQPVGVGSQNYAHRSQAGGQQDHGLPPRSVTPQNFGSSASTPASNYGVPPTSQLVPAGPHSTSALATKIPHQSSSWGENAGEFSTQNPMSRSTQPANYGQPKSTFLPDSHPYEASSRNENVGDSQVTSKVESSPFRAASVPRPSSAVGSALMESSPNPSPLPSPQPPLPTSSAVPLEDQFSSVSLNAAPSDISTAEEAFPWANVGKANPTAPPITSFGAPFAPPSDATFSQPTMNFTSYQSQPPQSHSMNSNPMFNQGYPNTEPTSPIYHQNQTAPPPPQSTGMPPPTARNSLGTARNAPPAPVATKGPIPAEHETLPKVLEQLRNACQVAAGQPQMKRKMEDVARKLEIFSEKLREGSLSAKTLSSLHRMVEALQNKDYSLALGIHTQLVTSGNFSEISSFLPAVKVLIQSATQLEVYI